VGDPRGSITFLPPQQKPRVLRQDEGSTEGKAGDESVEARSWETKDLMAVSPLVATSREA